MGRRTWSGRAGAAVAALALLGAACGDDTDSDDSTATTATTAAAGDETTTTTTAGDSGAANTLEITTLDYSFEGVPDEIPGGVTEITVTNDGAANHEIAFIEIGDTAIDQFFTDFTPVIQEGGAWPAYATNGIGANEVEPGATATLTYTLPAGTYALFCALQGTAEDPGAEEGAPHFTLGMQQVVTIGEGSSAADLPEGEGTITARDYEFDTDLPAGVTVIDFVNEGPNPHFASINRFPDGTTEEEAASQIETLLSLPEDQEPPEGLEFPEDVAFSGITTAGLGIQFSVPDGLAPGTYVALCFMSDLAGGPPHAIANGMHTVFTVE